MANRINKPTRKTALHRAILELKKRQSLYEDIDDVSASVVESCIWEIENYLDVEQKQIIKAYKDGLEDMRVRHHFRPNHYFENNFKEYDNE
jgi:hypothetical protein